MFLRSWSWSRENLGLSVSHGCAGRVFTLPRLLVVVVVEVSRAMVSGVAVGFTISAPVWGSCVMVVAHNDGGQSGAICSRIYEERNC
ncbi:hypothetical protein J3F83DRAFT_756465 [Trichoderma novae-zelandiae]